MKTLFLLLLFVLPVTSAVSQFHTLPQVDSALGLYPMNTGDVWQYHIHYIPSATDSVSSYFFVRVLADTLMQNGKRYKRFDRVADDVLGCSYCVYRRIDSSTACVYQYEDYPAPSESLLDSLGAKEGDEFWTGLFTVDCLRVDTLSVLGELTVAKEFEFWVVPETPHLTFAFGFGLVRRVEWNMWVLVPYPMYTELVYSKVSGNEYGSIVGVEGGGHRLPTDFSLSQNYPNPFNPSTTIKFELPQTSHVSLTVYDVLGRQVSVLVNERKAPGSYSVRFDGSHLASGVYFYRLVAGSFTETKRLLLIR